MNSNKVKLSTDSQAVVFFENAANGLRTYFEGQVLAALPVFARRALQRELESLAELSSDDQIPPLAEISLLRAEQCAHDLLSMNHEGPASAFLRQRVSEAATEIKAALLSSSRGGGNIVFFPAAPGRVAIGRTL